MTSQKRQQFFVLQQAGPLLAVSSFVTIQQFQHCNLQGGGCLLTRKQEKKHISSDDSPFMGNVVRDVPSTMHYYPALKSPKYGQQADRSIVV
jgi:hypothetical protein